VIRILLCDRIRHPRGLAISRIAVIAIYVRSQDGIYRTGYRTCILVLLHFGQNRSHSITVETPTRKVVDRFVLARIETGSVRISGQPIRTDSIRGRSILSATSQRCGISCRAIYCSIRISAYASGTKRDRSDAPGVRSLDMSRFASELILGSIRICN